MTTSSNLTNLQETIDLLIFEILGKFNFGEFKKIASMNVRQKEPRGKKPWDLGRQYLSHPEIDYAKRFLPELGQGSSRITFALSGGKVLKIAINNAGIEQNKAELDVFTKAGDNSVATKIFDFDPGYKWLVSEIVKPFSGRELSNLLKMELWIFWDMFHSANNGDDLGEMFKRKIQWLQEDIERMEQTVREEPPGSRYVTSLINNIKRKQEEVDQLKASSNNSFAIELAQKLVDFAKRTGLHPGDVSREDHLGRTVDGEIKLLDYGLTGEVFDKHYSGEPQPSSAGTWGSSPASGGSDKGSW